MKTMNILSLALTLFVTGFAQTAVANDDKYIAAMQKNIQAVYTAQTIDELQSAVNSFERIAQVEKNRWEPLYYSAFGYILMSTREQDKIKKDAWLDQAMSAIEKAKSLNAEESEIFALEGFAYMMRLTVDPPARGPQYSGLSMQSYNKALALNAENPRAIALLAQMQYGTAQFFGSSTAEACETARKSIEKFGIQQSQNPLAPMWGKQMAEEMLKGCQ